MSEKPGLKSTQQTTRLHPDKLTSREEVFVSSYAAGATLINSAISSGSKPQSAAKYANRMMKKPKIQKALDEIRAQARKNAVFTVERAMDEAQSALDFAHETGNATAYVKAVEHRAKLNGLLIERHHLKVETVDITGALNEARTRLDSVTDVTPRVENPTTQHDALSACTHILEMSTTKVDDTTDQT